MSFRTVDGTAQTSDSDYVAKTGTLTFASDETTKTITIEVKGDDKKESNETFYLDLSGLQQQWALHQEPRHRHNPERRLIAQSRNAAGGVLTAKQAPHRPGTAPALGLRRERCLLLLSQTEGEFYHGTQEAASAPRRTVGRTVLAVGQRGPRMEPTGPACHRAGAGQPRGRLPCPGDHARRPSTMRSTPSTGRSSPTTPHVHASHGASLEAAAAQAAHDTLAALFPSQASTFDAALDADLAGIPPGRARQGIDVGREVARQILDWRSTDGSGATVPYTPGTDPGDWQPTPPAFLPALAPQWPYVTPFAMTSGDAVPPGGPARARQRRVRGRLQRGQGPGQRQPARPGRTSRRRSPSSGTTGSARPSPLGYWNKIAQAVATEQGLSLVSEARLFALLNIATADALISCWDAKYAYNFWRPVTAIRAADTDGNPGTEPDSSWTPLLVTPNFPSYTSAHSTVSGGGGRSSDGPVRGQLPLHRGGGERALHSVVRQLRGGGGGSGAEPNLRRDPLPRSTTSTAWRSAPRWPTM